MALILITKKYKLNKACTHTPKNTQEHAEANDDKYLKLQLSHGLVASYNNQSGNTVGLY